MTLIRLRRNPIETALSKQPDQMNRLKELNRQDTGFANEIDTLYPGLHRPTKPERIGFVALNTPVIDTSIDNNPNA